MAFQWQWYFENSIYLRNTYPWFSVIWLANMLTSCLLVRSLSEFCDLYSSMTSSPPGFLSRAFFTIYSHKTKKFTIQSSRIKLFKQYTINYLLRLRVKVIHCIKGKSQKTVVLQNKRNQVKQQVHNTFLL